MRRAYPAREARGPSAGSGSAVSHIAVWLFSIIACCVAANAYAQDIDIDGGAAIALDGGAAEPADVPADPDAPTVGASLERAEGLVGDRLTLTVSAIGRKAITDTVRLPDPLALGKLEVLEVGRTDRDLGDGKWSRRFQLQVTAWEPGEFEIPSIPLAYTSAQGEARTAPTSPLAVNVRALVPDDPGAKHDLQPLRPTRSVVVEDARLYSYVKWGAIALGALVVGWVLARLIIARRRRALLRPAPPPPALPPHVIALDRLRSLRARGDYGRDEYRPFYFEVSEILRGYLGARFGFDSLELTTTELTAELARVGLPLPADDPRAARAGEGLPPSAPQIHSRIVAFLEDCDLVKFAKAPSDDPRALAALSTAEEVVQALVPPAQAPAQEALPLPADGPRAPRERKAPRGAA